jgi:hypothetical protein
MSDKNLPAQIARAVTVYKGKPSRKMMAQTGVDIELLEAVFALWEPRKDTLSNYQPLDVAVEKALFIEGRETYEHAKLDGSQPTLILLSGRLLQQKRGSSRLDSQLVVPREFRVKSDETHRHGMFAIFLTRDLKWIIFTNFPGRSFQIADNPRSAVHMAMDTLPAKTYFGSNGTQEVLDSLALELADGLTKSLRDSINAKKRIIDGEEPTHVLMKEYMNAVDKK